MSKYGSWIFEEPLALGMSLLDQAVDDRLEERAWLYYCVTLPYQDKNNRKTFPELLASLRKPKIKKSKQITEEELNRYVDIADLVRSR